MKSSALILILAVLVVAVFGGVAASGADLLVNRGFEEPYTNAVPATNWWYYGAAGRASWAARGGSLWGNSFFPAGNAFGGFGQDVTANLEKGDVFTFAISGRAETNYTNVNTTIGMEFWTNGSWAYSVARNVYEALDADRGEWVYLELGYTNEVPGVDKVIVRCDFADCTIPAGASSATCQWDDSRLYQSRSRELGTPSLGKFEPVSGVYLGVLLERGGTSQEILEFNANANKRSAVYAKFLIFKQDPFPWDWAEMVISNYPGAGLHLILEPMVDFEDFYAPDWGPGQETYDAALAFVTNCAHAAVPIFLRFAHEANGDWYPWHPKFSDRYGIPDTVSNETYITAFRNFADLVHSNAPNVAMVWAPNQGNGPEPMPYYGDVYPGDEYVDWVGLSVYNGRSYGNSNEVLDCQFKNAIEKGYWQENSDFYDDTFENFYWTFSDPDNPRGHHKPMMIAETAAAFEPKYAVSNEILIAGFESLDGPQYSVSNLLCQFQNLNADGLVTSNEHLLDGFEQPALWDWGPWTDLYSSNSTDMSQGTNAMRLGAKDTFVADAYVGGNGRNLTATNLSMYDGLVLDVKCADAGDADPLLVVGLRSPGATAAVTRVITGTSYYPLKIRFSEFTTYGAFALTNVDGLTLELISTEDDVRPEDVWVDNWRAADISGEPYVDQDWWPAGTNDDYWGDETDSNGGWHEWAVVTDELSGYPPGALRLSGFDGNTNNYVGGNGFSLKEADQDWSGASALSLTARRGDMTNAEALLSISLRDTSDVRTAQVSVVVVPTHYQDVCVPFSDMTATPDFDWSNVASVVFEMISGTPGAPMSSIYLKEFSIGIASNVLEQDWWTAGSGYQPWGDAAWTQSIDAAGGTYALQISGTVTNDSQWYIGGNGCSIAIPRQDWSESSAVIIYGKQGTESNRVQPKFKLTLDNDYAETNGNEAVIETKVANTNYYEMVMAFEDFHTDTQFAWTNVKMVKIELFTGEGGKQPNDLFLDEFRLASITLTNGDDSIKWKSDWCDQLYALEDFSDSDPADPDANPDYVNIFTHFRNVHMINWFHVKKFEDGFTKDLRIAEDGTGEVVYESYYERIKDGYFLTNIVIDTDGDGMPDDWELLHFPGGGAVTNADAQTDSDSDGVVNLDEYLAGTDPHDASSVLEVTGTVSNAGPEQFVIDWPSQPYRLYTIERSTNLLNGFETVLGRQAATPPMNSYTDTVSEARAHLYRIRLVP